MIVTHTQNCAAIPAVAATWQHQCPWCLNESLNFVQTDDGTCCTDCYAVYMADEEDALATAPDNAPALRAEIARLDRENATLSSLRDELIGRLASEMLYAERLQSQLAETERTLNEVIGERYPNQLSLR